MAEDQKGAERSPTPGPGKALDPHKVDLSEIEPLDRYGITTIAVGSIAWLIAFILMLPFYTQLEHAGRLWWLWTCLAGFGLGMYGLEVARWRRKREFTAQNPAGEPTKPVTGGGRRRR